MRPNRPFRLIDADLLGKVMEVDAALDRAVRDETAWADVVQQCLADQRIASLVIDRAVSEPKMQPLIQRQLHRAVRKAEAELRGKGIPDKGPEEYFLVPLAREVSRGNSHELSRLKERYLAPAHDDADPPSAQKLVGEIQRRLTLQRWSMDYLLAYWEPRWSDEIGRIAGSDLETIRAVLPDLRWGSYLGSSRAVDIVRTCSWYAVTINFMERDAYVDPLGLPSKIGEEARAVAELGCDTLVDWLRTDKPGRRMTPERERAQREALNTLIHLSRYSREAGDSLGAVFAEACTANKPFDLSRRQLLKLLEASEFGPDIEATNAAIELARTHPKMAALMLREAATHPEAMRVLMALINQNLGDLTGGTNTRRDLIPGLPATAEALTQHVLREIESAAEAIRLRVVTRKTMRLKTAQEIARAVGRTMRSADQQDYGRLRAVARALKNHCMNRSSHFMEQRREEWWDALPERCQDNQFVRGLLESVWQDASAATVVARAFARFEPPAPEASRPMLREQANGLLALTELNLELMRMLALIKTNRADLFPTRTSQSGSVPS